VRWLQRRPDVAGGPSVVEFTNAIRWFTCDAHPTRAATSATAATSIDTHVWHLHDGRMRIALVMLVSCAGAGAVRPDVTQLGDAKRWSAVGVESHAAAEGGKQVVRLAPVGGNRAGSNVGMALVAGLTLREGVIEVDLRGRGETAASFVGVAFGVTDPSRYEAVYFRPFRFRSQDAVDRTHAVQYIAWPEHTWEALRARSPGVYEAPIAPVPDPAGWFHARIEVARTTVKVFVDRAAQPALVVQRLRDDAGRVGLWIDSQEGWFANLEIRPAS
jgi:hypothetical protein